MCFHLFWSSFPSVFYHNTSLISTPGSLHCLSFISLSSLSLLFFMLPAHSASPGSFFSASLSLQKSAFDRTFQASPLACAPLLVCASVWIQGSVTRLCCSLPRHRSSCNSEAFPCWNGRDLDSRYAQALVLILFEPHSVALLHTYDSQNLKQNRSTLIHPFHHSVCCFTFQNLHVLGQWTSVATLLIWRRRTSWCGCLQFFLHAMLHDFLWKKSPCYLLHLAQALLPTFRAAPWMDSSNKMYQLVKLDYLASWSQHTSYPTTFHWICLRVYQD